MSQKIACFATSFHPALLLLGVYDRCTPLLPSEIGLLAAMLSSFEETSRVFNDKGVSIGINTIRQIAQHFATRAKIGQDLEPFYHTESLDRTTGGGLNRWRSVANSPG
jgi:hypothetical protein